MPDNLVDLLHARFEANMSRHANVSWTTVEKALKAGKTLRATVQALEDSGGEPDVVVLAQGALHFVDCAAQSPKGRRSVCYDAAALESRKEHKPKDSAVAMAERWGAELLTEADYRALQQLGAFDTTTSSWVATPPKIRKLGGALFCDRRFDTVFLYHNGAESYYAARGFRCKVKL